MSESASSELVPDTVPVIDTALYTANFTENTANQWGGIYI